MKKIIKEYGSMWNYYSMKDFAAANSSDFLNPNTDRRMKTIVNAIKFKNKREITCCQLSNKYPPKI